MDRLRLYRVLPHKDSDWQVLVAAYSARSAKPLGWRAILELISRDDVDYLDIRVHLVRHVAVPAEVTEPVVITSCEEARWTCKAWSGEGCPDTCPKRAGRVVFR